MLYIVPRNNPKAYRLLIRGPKLVATMPMPAEARARMRTQATLGDNSPESRHGLRSKRAEVTISSIGMIIP